MRDSLSIRLSSSTSRDGPAQEYFDHSSAPRINTDSVVISSLEHQYPNRHISIVPEYSANLLAFASAGHALALPDPNANATESGPLKWTSYVPPAHRLNGQQGILAEKVLFGKYKYAYQEAEFILYIIEGRDGYGAYPNVRNQYLVSPSMSSNAADALVMAAGQFGNQLHNEIWVFNLGVWTKDRALWESVQKSHWDDVILDAEMKKSIINDVTRFYDSRDTYSKLKVPWKRGIIYYGPPGNGKTISIKAMMHTLYDRPDPVPTLYVKTLAGYAPPEYMLGSIFGKARAEAPCYLVFEDLDSIVSDNVRSFFLNEVDGLSSNDGILMVGSTNHLDRLDPGIAKRPSRFDRKYLFPNPVFKERVQYAQFWRNKLNGENGNEEVEFPKKICDALAEITGGFSFAYMQEAFVAALLVIAGQKDTFDANGERLDYSVMAQSMGEYFVEHGGGSRKNSESDDNDLEKYILWRELKKQSDFIDRG
ncbi:P-loop containing nucleoside triphosphate hydrolase protein [Rhizodiscina lignyota]|uniref:P-loop containing nucleoside triphosphate hydrolase protein n=1 Tax=Rhizodiscina lignyota TaxID=1504668 RepID=A0A9P4IDR7_9PEZI|nr:P-loop containing nucleoside triphosphate hydrolase protein [Rhizodiscina lignyota]